MLVEYAHVSTGDRTLDLQTNTLTAGHCGQVFPDVTSDGADDTGGEDGLIWLVDWDSPLIAPRERDLLFVVGSRIGRPVEPKHEDCFFAGYGPMEIDPDALIYYRYERMIEDIGEIGLRMLFDADLGEQAREVEAGLIMNLFETKGSINQAETVARSRWTSTLV